MKKVLIVLSGLLFCSAFAEDFYKSKIPNWYSGDKNLYINFLKSCIVVKDNCSDENLDCLNIENIDKFNKIYTQVLSCTVKRKEPEHKTPEKIRKANPTVIGVASVRG